MLQNGVFKWYKYWIINFWLTFNNYSGCLGNIDWEASENVIVTNKKIFVFNQPYRNEEYDIFPYRKK